jgi:hypothetical protein
MNNPSFRDVELLSAYLDGQLSPAERTRLENRIKSDPSLAAIQDDLRQTRLTLRKTPMRPVPRNFTLTPKMAGIRPPLPRLVPALSWASALASLFFIFTLGSQLLGQLTSGGGASMLAAAPQSSAASGLGGGMAATTAPGLDNGLNTPTPEAYLLGARSLPTPSGERNLANPPMAPKALSNSASPWLYIWPGLAMLLIGTAMLIRWFTMRVFRRKYKL